MADSNGKKVAVDQNGKKQPKAVGLPGVLGDMGNSFQNFLVDSGVNNSNFWGWVTGGDQSMTPRKFVQQQDKALNQQSKLYRTDWARPNNNKVVNTSLSRADKLAQQNAQAADTRAAQDAVYANRMDQWGNYYNTPDPGPQSLQDWIKYAQDVSSQAGGGFDYSGEIANQQARGGQNSQYLQAMYRALQNATDAARPSISAAYDKTGAEIGQDAGVASAGINEAYNDARQQSLQEANALGFGKEYADIAQRGQQDQAFNNSSIQSNASAAQTKINQDEAAALQLNTGASNAAKLAGFEAQVQNQRGLEDRIAGLQQQQAGADNARKNAVLQLAMQLQGAQSDAQATADQQAWTRQQAEAQFAAKLQQQQQDNAARAKQSASSNLLKVLGLYSDPNQGFQQYKTLSGLGLL